METALAALALTVDQAIKRIQQLELEVQNLNKALAQAQSDNQVLDQRVQEARARVQYLLENASF